MNPKNQLPPAAPRPFDILMVLGQNSIQETLKDFQDQLAEKLDAFAKKGILMRPCGAPIILRDDNFWKIIIMLWLDHGQMMMLGIMDNLEQAEEGKPGCDHRMGYESQGGGLICKGCGQPLE